MLGETFEVDHLSRTKLGHGAEDRGFPAPGQTVEEHWGWDRQLCESLPNQGSKASVPTCQPLHGVAEPPEQGRDRRRTFAPASTADDPGTPECPCLGSHLGELERLPQLGHEWLEPSADLHISPIARIPLPHMSKESSHHGSLPIGEEGDTQGTRNSVGRELEWCADVDDDAPRGKSLREGDLGRGVDRLTRVVIVSERRIGHGQHHFFQEPSRLRWF